MANPEHVSLLASGARVWNSWRRDHPTVHPDLCGADLRGRDLGRTELEAVDLSWANLSESILVAANLRGSALISANLLGANARQANLSGATLIGADLGEANLSEADLSGANLERALLVGTNLEDSTLTGCHVFGISAWGARLDRSRQSNIVITPFGEPTIQVDSLDVAQFVYLLLNNKRIRDVIDTVGKKAVLILGRFVPDRKLVLDAIRESLRHCGYLPILFDFEKPSNRDLQETIMILAGISRFILADITEPRSVPQELAVIVPTLPSVPVQPLLQRGFEQWAMYDHIKRFQWVLPLITYDNHEGLVAELKRGAIATAEAKAKEQLAM